MSRKPKNAETPPEPRRSQLHLALAVCGLLLLAVWLVFRPTIDYEFVNFDDDVYVYDNPELSHGLSAQGIHWAFTTNRGSQWAPLTWLSYLVDYQIYGLKPWGYHLTNVLLHAATTVLLFLVLWRMTGELWPCRVRGRRVRHPSAAGGIGRLGRGTEGRAQRAVLRADARRRISATFAVPSRSADTRPWPCSSPSG